MNKFVLILPLLVLAVFLGYFGSNLPTEWFFAVVILMVVVVAIAVYVLLLEKQKAGEGKRRRKF
jgi:uncharacterized membrane protein YfcA